MHHLGYSRNSYKPDHLLQTPDTFVRAPLPGMRNATAIIHAAPALGAKFTQYTAELEPGGTLGRCRVQRFLYVIAGELTLSGSGELLRSGGYAYLPTGDLASLEAKSASRVVVIEKHYQLLGDLSAPTHLVGAEAAVTPTPLLGDADLEVRTLLPGDASFDFAVNTMTYQPGATLPMVEMHVMEHGLLMLEGGGIYRLGDCWYPVQAGDFIWMAPYCPQWFGALGKTPAKYLIYKDWNRHPLE